MTTHRRDNIPHQFHSNRSQRFPRLSPEERRNLRNYNQSYYYQVVRRDESTLVNGPSVNSDSFSQSLVVTHPSIRNYGPGPIAFRDLIRRGQGATSSANNRKGFRTQFGHYVWDYSSIRTTVVPNPDEVRTTRMHGNFNMNPIPVASGSISAALNNRALSMFVRKARRAQSSLQGGEFIRDIGATLRSFSRVRMIFLRALRSHVASAVSIREQILGRDTFRPVSNRRRRDLNRQLSSNWLEFNFGILPTLSDLEDIGFGLWRAVDDFRNGADRRYVMGWAQETVTDPVVINPIAPASVYAHSNLRVNATVVSAEDLFVAYYGSVAIHASTNMGSQAQQLGLTFSNFIPTLYNLIPYSWVLDYFTNTGDIVDAFCFPASDILWVNKMTRCQKRTIVYYDRAFTTPTIARSITRNEFGASPDEFISSVNTRDTYIGGLLPSFRWHLPYRSTDWVNMLAIIGNML